MIFLDRTLVDVPLPDVVPLLLDMAEAIDTIMRVRGIEPVIWTLRDDGRTISFVPHIPADCRPETACVQEILAAIVKGKLDG